LLFTKISIPQWIGNIILYICVIAAIFRFQNLERNVKLLSHQVDQLEHQVDQMTKQLKQR